MLRYPTGPTSSRRSTVITRLCRAGAALSLALVFATCATDATTAANLILAFVGSPGNATAGANLGTVRVEVRQASGGVSTGFSGVVTVALTPGSGSAGATLSGTLSVAAVDGVVTFGDLSIDRAGVGYTLTATNSEAGSEVSTAFDIAPGALDQLAFTVQPAQAVAGASMAPAVQVTARDAFGNTVTSFNGAVTMQIGTNPAGGTLGGTTTVAAASGVATFSSLTIDRSASGYTLTATTAGPPATAGTSAAFTVVAAAASQLVFTSQPASTTAGALMNFAVTALDPFGNVATGFTGNVTLAIGNNPGGATLSGTTALAAVAGVANFSVSINRTGSGYTFTAAASGLAGATSQSFDIATGLAAMLAFTSQPANATAGTLIGTVRVTAQDNQGNPVTSFTGDITLAIGTNPGGGVLAGTKTVTAVAGVAQFTDLSIERSGVGYTLTATAPGNLTGTSAGFDITPAAASQLAFTRQPPSTIAGATISPGPQVTAQDPFGNAVTSFTGDVTVAIGTNPGTGVLAGTPMVAAVNGVATFGALNINRSGTGYTLNATAPGLAGATSSTFDIVAGAATKLVYAVAPANTSAGAPIAPAVQVAAQDALGNTDLTYVANVMMAIGTNPGGGTLSGATTLAASGGVATFSNLSIERTGTGYTLTATSGSLTPVTSAGFDVGPAVATTLVFTTSPVNTTAGQSIPTVQVTVRDGLGNTSTDYVGNVLVAITGATGTAGAVLSGTTPAAVSAGVASFPNLSIDKAGTGYTLTATSGTLAAGSSSPFNIAAGAATKLAFTVSPVTTTAGQAMAPAIQVAAQDAFGNTDPTFGGMINVAIGANPGGGTLTGSLSGTASGGVATFTNLSIDKSGVGYTLGATGGSLTGGTSAAFDIVAAAATQLAFTVPPGNTVAGAAMAPAVQVTARDQFGNVATSFVDPITVAIGTNPGAGVLGGTTTVGASGGVATFSTLNINKSGTGYTLTANSGAFNALSPAFNIVAGAATQVGFIVQPVNTTAGVAIAPAVQVAAQDAFGNTNTTYAGSITVAIGTNPGAGVLSGTATVTASGGVATFSTLRINRSGVGYTLGATSGTLTAGASTPFNIVSAPAIRLAFFAQPGPATAGVAMSPAVVVTAQDSLGNTATTYGGNITLAIGTNPSLGVLSGATTQAASAGVATFSNLSINKSGNGYTLNATSSPVLTAAASAAFNVAPGAATALFFTVQPTNTTVSTTISPAMQVTARDAFGNDATGFVGNVMMAILNNPGGGTLGGSVTRAAVSGIATFSTLNINAVGTGYTLRATSGTLTAAVSLPFNILSPVATTLFFTVQPSRDTAGKVITPAIQVTARDQSGATVTSFGDPITLAITSGTGASGAVLSGTTTQGAISGTATFADLSINKSSTGYKLTATSGSLTGTSAFFTIDPAAAATISFRVQPTNEAANTAITPQIEVVAKDALGNVATQFVGSVTMAIGTNPSAGLLTGTTAVTAVSGVAIFSNLLIDQPGIGYTLVASTAGLADAISGSFDITAAAGDQLVFTTQPATTTAGVSMANVVVTARNSTNTATITTFNGPVTVSITGGTGTSGATLSGTTTVNAVSGVATFSGLSIDKRGFGYRLSATANNLAGVTSNTFTINAGAAARLDFSVQPVTTTAGQVITPAVQVTARDAQGNVADAFTGPITVAISANPGGGTLSGTLTANAIGGVASFSDLSIEKSGTGYRLVGTSVGLVQDESNAFSINGAAAASLVFTVQPSTATRNVVINPSIRVSALDVFGNVATGFVDPITLVIANNPGGGLLGGTTTITAASGVSIFSDITISQPGIGYTLNASSGVLPMVTSTAFNIN